MLLRRGKTYYCRVWVPLELRDVIGRKELKKSLRTSNRKEAKAVASELIRSAETAFLRLRMGMLTDRELEQITAKLVADFTGRIEDHRRKLRDGFDFLCQGVPLGMDANRDLLTIDTMFRFPKTNVDVQSVADFYRRSIQTLEEELATGWFSRDTRVLAERLAAGKVELPPKEWFNENHDAWNSPPPVDFARICNAVLSGMIEAYQAELGRVQGRRNPAVEAAVATRVEQARPKARLSQLWASFKADRLSTRSWAASTLKKYEGFYNLFLDVLGDCELVAFEEEGFAARFITSIQKYPRGKNQITSPYRHKPFDPTWAEQPGFKGLQTAQINDMLIQLGAWFDYALDNPKHWGISQNPLKKKRLPEPEYSKKPKTAYTAEEIEKLVVGLMKQRPLVQPERFWIPLLGLFTGARINELCQLRVEDIKCLSGIWCIHIRHLPSSMQFTKTKRSRYCPVHPMLIDLGFIDLVSLQGGRGHDRLFPNLKLTGDKWSKRFGQWFNEAFEPKYVSAAPDKSFHSTRHSLISWFKANTKMDLHNLSVLKSMVGHLDNIDTALIGGIDLDNDMTWGEQAYGDKHSPKVQLALLKKLDYGVDFSVLKRRLK